MTRKELLARFDFLTEVLIHTKDLGYFSIGQRICIHQERAAIMECLNTLDFGDPSKVDPKYTIPGGLERIARRAQHDFHF